MALLQSSRWDFNLDSQKSNLPAPPGYKMEADESSSVKKKADKKAMMEKRAWEIATAPAKQCAMHLFMIWMGGKSPGIFSVMIVFWLGSSVVTSLGDVNKAFAPLTLVDCTLQKLSYIGINLAMVVYLIWHASGMGLIPVMSGDWVGQMPEQHVLERAYGIVL